MVAATAIQRKELEKLASLIHMDESAFLKAFSFYNERPLDVCIKVVSARLNDEQKRITYHLLYDLAQVDRISQYPNKIFSTVCCRI